MTDIPVPTDTPAITKQEKINNRWLVATMVLAAATLFAAIALVYFRFNDQAKQSTTQLAATRTLQVAERQDCRADYASRRNDVLEGANSAARDVLAATVGYLLSLNSTADIQEAKQEQDQANARVSHLKSLTQMVDDGWTDPQGRQFPACPTVR